MKFSSHRWVETSTPEYAKGRVMLWGTVGVSGMDIARMPVAWVSIPGTTSHPDVWHPWFIWKKTSSAVTLRRWAAPGTETKSQLKDLVAGLSISEDQYSFECKVPIKIHRAPEKIVEPIHIYKERSLLSLVGALGQRQVVRLKARGPYNFIAYAIQRNYLYGYCWNRLGMQNVNGHVGSHLGMLFKTRTRYSYTPRGSWFRLYADREPKVPESSVLFRVRLRAVDFSCLRTANFVPVMVPSVYEVEGDGVKLELCATGLAQLFGYVPMNLVFDCNKVPKNAE